MSDRDNQHMRIVLTAIERCWKVHPDLSLGQLLIVKLRPSRAIPELFRLTDEELLGMMRSDCYDPTSSGRLSSS